MGVLKVYRSSSLVLCLYLFINLGRLKENKFFLSIYIEKEVHSFTCPKYRCEIASTLYVRFFNDI